MKNYLSQSEDMWYELFNHCLDIGAEKFEKLIKQSEKEVLSLPQKVLEEIIDRGFHAQQKTGNGSALEVIAKFMMKIKLSTCSSIFELIS